MSELQEEPKNNKAAMTAIIMIGIVVIICILACAGVALAFIMNMPW